MLLGSHHSMSYLEPVGKFRKFLHFFRRTQDIDIKTQYMSYSVRVFDIRLYVDNELHVHFTDGCGGVNSNSIYETFGFLNSMSDCYVKITLDLTDSDFIGNLIFKKHRRFSDFCEMLEEIYPNITFFGGKNNQTDELVYRFTKNKYDLKEISLIYRSESMFKEFFVNLFRKICPRIFVKTRNSAFYSVLATDPNVKTFYYMDFVNLHN